MKIAFCTPLHAQSAIGRVSISVADELTRRGHIVSLINIERVPSPGTQPSVQPQISWKNPEAAEELQAANVIVSNFFINQKLRQRGFRLFPFANQMMVAGFKAEPERIRRQGFSLRGGLVGD